MERYFQIGELSKMYGVGTDTIRHYEELGLISPIRAANGYRMYRYKDIWRMNVIRDLRSIGFSLEHINDYLKNRSVESTTHSLLTQQQTVTQQMEQLSRVHKNIESRLNALEEAQKKPIGTVENTYYPPRRCHELARPFSTDEEMDVIIKQLLNRLLNRLYIIGNTHIGSKINSAALKDDKAPKYTSVFIVDDEATDSTLPAGNYVTLRYKGSSQSTRKHINTLLDYINANNLQLQGDILELILVDIHVAADYDEHIAELQARVVTKEN